MGLAHFLSFFAQKTHFSHRAKQRPKQKKTQKTSFFDHFFGPNLLKNVPAGQFWKPENSVRHNVWKRKVSLLCQIQTWKLEKTSFFHIFWDIFKKRRGKVDEKFSKKNSQKRGRKSGGAKKKPDFSIDFGKVFVGKCAHFWKNDKKITKKFFLEFSKNWKWFKNFRLFVISKYRIYLVKHVTFLGFRVFLTILWEIVPLGVKKSSKSAKIDMCVGQKMQFILWNMSLFPNLTFFGIFKVQGMPTVLFQKRLSKKCQKTENYKWHFSELVYVYGENVEKIHEKSIKMVTFWHNFTCPREVSGSGSPLFGHFGHHMTPQTYFWHDNTHFGHSFWSFLIILGPFQTHFLHKARLRGTSGSPWQILFVKPRFPGHRFGHFGHLVDYFLTILDVPRPKFWS